MRHKYLDNDDILYEDDEYLYVYVGPDTKYRRSKWLVYSQFINIGYLNIINEKNSILLIIYKPKPFSWKTKAYPSLEVEYATYNPVLLNFWENHSDNLLTEENIKRCGNIQYFINDLRYEMLKSDELSNDIKNNIIRSYPSLIRKTLTKDECFSLIDSHDVPSFFDITVNPLFEYDNLDYLIMYNNNHDSRLDKKITKTKGIYIITFSNSHLWTTKNFKFTEDNSPEWVCIHGPLGYTDMLKNDLISFGYPEEKISIIIGRFV